MQWDARYAGVRADELDARMRQLAEGCMARDLPIFTHCHVGELEAQRGYGRQTSAPEHWAALLTELDGGSPGSCPLRLCFGHAGGPPGYRLPDAARGALRRLLDGS